MVQTADSVTIEGNTLRLENVNPHTVYFSDRPKRLAGLMPTDKMIASWSKTFGDDPPNATPVLHEKISEKGVSTSEIVITLLSAKYEGDVLIYKYKVILGEVLEGSGPGTLFIDHLSELSNACNKCPAVFGCQSIL